MGKGNKIIRRQVGHGKHPSDMVKLCSEGRASAPQLTVELSMAWTPAPRGRNYRKDEIPATAAFSNRRLSSEPGKLHPGKTYQVYSGHGTGPSLQVGISPETRVLGTAALLTRVTSFRRAAV